MSQLQLKLGFLLLLCSLLLPACQPIRSNAASAFRVRPFSLSEGLVEVERDLPGPHAELVRNGPVHTGSF